MPARHDIRRRVDQFVANPQCEANVLSAVHGVSMAAVARADGLTVASGQSPFAIARGTTFERQLFADGARVLREALARAGVLPAATERVVDLRLRAHGGPLPDLAASARAFAGLLADLAAGQVSPPALVLAPAMRLPGDTFLPDGVLAADVVTVHPAEHSNARPAARGRDQGVPRPRRPHRPRRARDGARPGRDLRPRAARDARRGRPPAGRGGDADQRPGRRRVPPAGRRVPGGAWVQLAMELLVEALREWGVGGKTSAGYGRLEPAG